MRAILLFDSLPKLKLEPRSDLWLSVLDQCSRHDPDNALYDYLAAIQLWFTGTTWDPSGHPRVIDAEEFERGTKRFETGQLKPYVAIGEEGVPAIAAFLASSGIPHSDQVELLESLVLILRQSALHSRLQFWLDYGIERARRSGNTANTIALLRQQLKLYDQFQFVLFDEDETTARQRLNDLEARRREVFDQLSKLVEKNPSASSPADVTQLRNNEQRRRIETIVLEDALSEQRDRREQAKGRTLLASVFAISALEAALWLAIVGTVALLIERYIFRHDGSPPPFGVVRHTVAWLMGVGCTFAVVGMAPAELISHELQTRITMGVLWFAVAGSVFVAVLGLYRFLLRRQLRFGLRSLFLGMAIGTATVTFVWPYFMAMVVRVERYEPNFSVPAKGWKSIDAEVLRYIVLRLDKGTWHWAAVQSKAYGAQYIGSFVSLLIIVVWYTRRTAYEINTSVFGYWTKDAGHRWPLLVGCIGRGALVAAICWLTIYVWSASAFIQAAESDFRSRLRCIRDTQTYRDEIRAVIDSTASSENEIRKSVEAEPNTIAP